MSMDILSNPAFLKGLAAFNTIWLGLVAGAALSMYFFSMPIIKTGRSFSSAVMLRQFHHLITLGARYLQNGSRIQGVTLTALIYLLYRHPDPEVASRWWYYAVALFVGVQVAWFEVVFIFPTNDRLVEMEEELRASSDPVADQKMRAEVMRLLEKWQRWHIGRIIIPLVCVSFSICGLMF